MPKTKTAAPAKKPAPARKTAARQAAPKPERKVKEIAGVKVPKDLREVAAAAQKMMENPLVRDIVSAGVLAAMAAFAEAQQKKSSRPGAVGGAGAEELGRNADGLKKTAKVVAGAAAGAMGKRLMDEVKTRGPELIAKIEKPKREKREDRNSFEDEAAVI